MSVSHLNDIEDLPTDQLRAEIHRREQATLAGKCWYCNMNLEAHTCKYAKLSPIPGWEIKPPRYVRTDDCMGNEVEYWQTDGWHPVMNEYVIGVGDSKEEANTKCIDNARKRQKKWTSEPPGRGGYINRFGVRVPNPCGEIDLKGRDMDRFGRNVRPGQKWDDATIDDILANPENK